MLGLDTLLQIQVQTRNPLSKGCPAGNFVPLHRHVYCLATCFAETIGSCEVATWLHRFRVSVPMCAGAWIPKPPPHALRALPVLRPISESLFERSSGSAPGLEIMEGLASLRGCRGESEGD